ncbi:hypothetical protein CALVIDRAFT_360534 [Calocera viscosa TUFC12733]|uniref:Uncharacterized protein n=1 Tax=Calocera viscosa (strain TUFC12733) TaxID=1330018 RepID=A0A167QJ46_CALVF|nr:hypothetical protein CALVIDRAFT_360534 [Calocera viscosa TUFC12733]
MADDLGPRTFLRLHARDPDSDPSPASARATNYFILQSHVMLKGAQVGSLIGPLAVLLRRRFRPTTAQMLGGSVAWAGWTALGALVMGVGRVWSAEPYDDRAYRLNHNLSQNRVDRISLTSALLGSALSLFALPSSLGLRTRLLGGGVTGLAGGVLVHVISQATMGTGKEEEVMIKVGEGKDAADANAKAV